jgi:hypothetical protein
MEIYQIVIALHRDNVNRPYKLTEEYQIFRRC